MGTTVKHFLHKNNFDWLVTVIRNVNGRGKQRGRWCLSCIPRGCRQGKYWETVFSLVNEKQVTCIIPDTLGKKYFQFLRINHACGISWRRENIICYSVDLFIKSQKMNNINRKSTRQYRPVSEVIRGLRNKWQNYDEITANVWSCCFKTGSLQASHEMTHPRFYSRSAKWRVYPISGSINLGNASSSGDVNSSFSRSSNCCSILCIKSNLLLLLAINTKASQKN